jgi:hypothetical protein
MTMRSRLWIWARWELPLYLADRLPWFARKHAINLLMGREVYWDFMLAERSSGDMFSACVKW